jgi:8-oxo-dGTP diphosphatase
VARSVAGIAWRDGRVLLARRIPGGVNGGRWEFPGGKAEPGENPARSLAREFAEELGVEIAVGALLAVGSFRHRNTDYRLEAYRIELSSTELALREHEDVGWFTFDEARALELVPSDRSILPQLEAALG